MDDRWRLVWASPEFRASVGKGPEDDVGIGLHYVETRAQYDHAVTLESGREWARTCVPYMIEETDGGLQTIIDRAPPRMVPALTGLRPKRPPPRWAFTLDFRGVPTLGRIHALAERIVTDDGRLLGNLFVYGTSLPASLLAFVARGDQGMYTRAAELAVAPGRRAAAILFADLEGSTALSRRLPSARYFELMQRLTTGMDQAVIDSGGIVGKHAGDGVSAFFLAEQAGGPSAAARAAVGAARAMREVAAALDQPSRLNVGVHWGATLYMGQITTGGRLEVTALGDEVNECARIQEAAREGALLASKPLLERLEPADAAALDLDPGAIEYRTVAELPGASEKARRDAGLVAVADLAPARAS
jgi:class 3 adenylate cyclase